MVDVSVRLKYVRLKDDAILERGGAVYVAAERAGERAVDHVHAEMLAMDLIDSGELYDSIDYEIFRSGKGISISVGSDKPRSKYVEYGTDGPIPADGPKPMPVKIKRGPFLIVSRVKGQEPKPYLRNALRHVSATDWRR